MLPLTFDLTAHCALHSIKSVADCYAWNWTGACECTCLCLWLWVRVRPAIHWGFLHQQHKPVQLTASARQHAQQLIPRESIKCMILAHNMCTENLHPWIQSQKSLQHLWCTCPKLQITHMTHHKYAIAAIRGHHSQHSNSIACKWSFKKSSSERA